VNAAGGPWTFGWEALVAIGALAAAFVALYVGPIRERLRRPSVMLSHTPREDIVRDHSASEDLARFRLRVHAAPGKEAALNVEVFIESVSESVQEPIRALLPAGGEPLRVPHSDATAQIVPAGSTRFVDLAELRRPSGGDTAARLLLATTPVDLHLGKPCRLEITVSGANLDSRAYRCEVDWKAEFDPNGFPDEALDVAVYAKTSRTSRSERPFKILALAYGHVTRGGRTHR
jgi:hypothetical protein